MADIAVLGIKVENGQVTQATRAMDGLTVASAKTEAATARVSRRMGLMQIEARRMDAAMTAAARSQTLFARASAGASAALARFGPLIGAVIGFAAVRQAVQMADAWTNMSSRLALVTKNSAELASVQSRLFAIAQDARTPLEQTAQLYERIARNAGTLGLAQEQVLRVTETINKAMVVSGASGASAAAALTQLSQAFASGTLRGEELNSVLEQAPRLAQAIAEGMGVTVGQLRELGKAGALSAKAVTDALLAQSAAVDREFNGMAMTVSGAMTVLRNALLKAVGESNELTGATNGIADAIVKLANVIPTLVRGFNQFFTNTMIGWENISAAVRKFHNLMSIDLSGNIRQQVEQMKQANARIDFDRNVENARLGRPSAAASRVFGGGGGAGAGAGGAGAAGAIDSVQDELLRKATDQIKDAIKAEKSAGTATGTGRSSQEVYESVMGQMYGRLMADIGDRARGAWGGVVGAYQAGQQTTSRTKAGGMGAMQGAAAGSAFGPIGTAVGALAGFTAGIIGSGKAAKEAALQLVEMRKSMEFSLAMVRAEVAGDDLQMRLLQEHQKFEQLRKQAHETYTGRAGEPERNRVLDELNALEARRIDQLRKEAGAIRDVTGALINLAPGYKLAAGVFNAMAPLTSAPNGTRPDDTSVTLVMDGEKVGSGVLRGLQRRAARTFGDSSRWSELVVT